MPSSINSSDYNFISAKDVDPRLPDLMMSPRMVQEYLKGLDAGDDSCSYDSERAVLKIKGVEIELPESGFERLLCGTLFRSGRPLAKSLDWDEVRSKWDRHNPDKYSQKTVTGAARRLNERVQKQLGSNDQFLKPAGKLIGINRIYL